MYCIEKSYEREIDGQYSLNTNHKWTKAWPGGKALFRDLSQDEAVVAFELLTSKVRSAPYRLRCVHSNAVVACINTMDEKLIKSLRIRSIGFRKAVKAVILPLEIKESLGVVAASSGVIVGAASSKSQLIQDLVEDAAQKLQSIVLSHRVITRYNSNGQSGGAWLVTSLTDGFLSNSDVGITFSTDTNEVSLHISKKYLKDDSTSFYQLYPSLEIAIQTLQELAKHATEKEMELFRI